jgi:hypothetical protein
MKNKLIYVLLLFFFTACNQLEKNKQQIESESNVIEDSFKYREILDSVDIIDDREFWDCVYGDWKITSIAKVGGNLIEESKIRNQVGKYLTIERNFFGVDLLGDKYILDKPIYEIEAIDNEAGPILKGSSFFYGYKMCRDSVFHVVVNGFDSLSQEHNLYIELISCDEVSTYYDGIIYFYERTNKEPNKINSRFNAVYSTR